MHSKIWVNWDCTESAILTIYFRMAPQDILGRYTVWATRGGKREVSQRCATWVTSRLCWSDGRSSTSTDSEPDHGRAYRQRLYRPRDKQGVGLRRKRPGRWIDHWGLVVRFHPVARRGEIISD